MVSLEKLLKDENVVKEYRKTFLLNLFQKFCSKMDKDEKFRSHIRQIYRESVNKIETTQVLIKKHLDCEVSLEDSKMIQLWIDANLKKTSKRKIIPLSLKNDLIKKQSGRCVACGEMFDTDLSKVHVDHVIPWKLVGDELNDNFQALCETCNECKSAKTDYIFKCLMKLA